MVSEMVVYPAEFYFTWSDFEEWREIDSVYIHYLMNLFVSTDWFFELMRERLTEIYDKDFVDRLMPFQREHLYQFDNHVHITDAELERIGLYDPDHAKNLYEIDEDLLHLRHAAKTDKLKFEESIDTKLKDETYRRIVSPAGTGGSNSFAIHGNYTKNGKPILASDPHLEKVMHSFWYAARVSWNATDPDSGEVYRTYLAGGTLVGTPNLTYGRSPFAAWGPTALNPDV